MKCSLIALTCILIFTSSLSFSQSDWAFGLNLGGTFSNIRGNDFAEKNDAALDFLIGSNIEYSINDNISLKANINYEKKSYKQDLETFSLIDEFDPLLQGTSIEVKSTLSYLSVPILLKYKFGNTKNFFINGGPFLGFFLDASTKVDGTKIDENSNDLFKSTDFGLSLGIGTRIILNDTNNLNIEIRDNLGLSNISKVPVFNNGSVKTNSINLLVNWEFSL